MAQKIIFNQFFRPFASTFFFARVDFWPFWGAQQECSPKAKKPHRIMFFLKIEIFMFNLFYQTLEPRKKTPPSILSTLGSLFGPIFCPNFKKSAHTRYRRNSKHVWKKAIFCMKMIKIYPQVHVALYQSSYSTVK